MLGELLENELYMASCPHRVNATHYLEKVANDDLPGTEHKAEITEVTEKREFGKV